MSASGARAEVLANITCEGEWTNSHARTYVVNLERYSCKECKGAGICEHLRRKARCKECSLQQQPMPPPSSNSRALPPPPTAAASALSADAEKNVVVLRDWSFGELKQTQTNSNHLGFCVVGTLVYHPRTNPMSFGLEFHSSEIRGIHSNGIVVSRNMSLYRLEGPADPARYNAQARLAAIMQPLCRSTWPSNAQALFEQVSKFFRSDKQDSVGLGFQNSPTAGGAAPKPTHPLAPSPPSEP